MWILYQARQWLVHSWSFSWFLILLVVLLPHWWDATCCPPQGSPQGSPPALICQYLFINKGTMPSWLVQLPLDWAVQVQALARARHLSLIVALSTQVYKWVPANLKLGVTLPQTSIPSRWEDYKSTPSRLMLHKPEISTGLFGHLARMQTHLPTHLYIWVALWE